MYTPQKATGTVTGTGSDITVEVGFQPDYVLVSNETQVTRLEYVGNKASKITNAPAFSHVTTLTVSSTGFTIAAAEQAAADVIYYMAIG